MSITIAPGQCSRTSNHCRRTLHSNIVVAVIDVLRHTCGQVDWHMMELNYICCNNSNNITRTGCLQLLEILEISFNLYGPPGKCCVKCRWSTALVSSHNETGYRIAYLRKWSLFLSLPWPPCCVYHVCVLYLGKLVDSVHCITGRSNANMSWIFLEIPPGISWKFVQLNL